MPRRVTCSVCTINLTRSNSEQKEGRPSARTMPCNIEDCPYEHYDYEKVKAIKKRELTHRYQMPSRKKG
jgi:hypothetical protein